MVAGPNGSGKTTLVDYFRRSLPIPLGHYLNPDKLDQELIQSGQIDLGRRGIEVLETDLVGFLSGHPLAPRADLTNIVIRENSLCLNRQVPTGYLASMLSDYLRRRWMQQGLSFTFETVMSSRDKLDLLTHARVVGYRTYLYYVCTDAPVINQQRVANRVLDGGHGVPADKILRGSGGRLRCCRTQFSAATGPFSSIILENLTG